MKIKEINFRVQLNYPWCIRLIDSESKFLSHLDKDNLNQSPVFPLANSLLFPHAVQALHIFEPRYVKMVRDSLRGNRYISMALLKPGYEADYHGSPEVYSTACLGKIIDYRELPDDKFHLALQGLAAVDLVSEKQTADGFRIFDIQLRDYAGDMDVNQQSATRQGLYELLRAYFLLQSGLETDPEALCSDMSFSSLVDNLCFLIPLDGDRKIKLLRSLRVSERSFLLQSFLEQEIKLMQELKLSGKGSSGAQLGPFYPRSGPVLHDI